MRGTGGDRQSKLTGPRIGARSGRARSIPPSAASSRDRISAARLWRPDCPWATSSRMCRASSCSDQPCLVALAPSQRPVASSSWILMRGIWTSGASRLGRTPNLFCIEGEGEGLFSRDHLAARSRSPTRPAAKRSAGPRPSDFVGVPASADPNPARWHAIRRPCLEHSRSAGPQTLPSRSPLNPTVQRASASARKGRPKIWP